MDENKNTTTNPEDATPENEINETPQQEEAGGNVIPFPTDETSDNPTETNEGGNYVESDVDNAKAAFKGLIDPDKPIVQKDIDKVSRLISQIGDNVRIVKSIWEDTLKEYHLTDSQMKALYNYNIQHRDPEPEHVEGEEAPEYDRYNGVDKLTDADVTNIFCVEHPIWGVDLAQTKDRIKDAFKEFIEYISIMKEYRDVNNALAVLQNMYEDEQMAEFQKNADEEQDPDEKAKKQASIDLYWKCKYLDFMSDPVEEATIRRIVNAFNDKNKCQYWMDRTARKMGQLKLSPTFLMEIYKFEEHYLDEKYHHLNNILFLYFMHMTTYVDVHDRNSLQRSQVVFMYNTLDNFVQNRLPQDRRQQVLDNITALVDNFMGKIPEGVPGVLNSD